MNRIAMLFVLSISVLLAGCGTNPIYRPVPIAYSMVKVCDPSGWNCRYVTVAVPMTVAAPAPQQPAAQPKQTTETATPATPAPQPAQVVYEQPQPVFYSPVPMYYGPQIVYYNPLLDFAIGVGEFRQILGGHHHH